MIIPYWAALREAFLRKYRFDFGTNALKIGPLSDTRAATPMNEEIRNATEIAKDPSSYSAATYLWVLVLSLWGGVVRIKKEVRLGDKSWKEIIGIFCCELIVSGFAGVLSFYLCEAAGTKPLYTAVAVGISGYMGGRAISVMEAIYKARNSKGDA